MKYCKSHILWIMQINIVSYLYNPEEAFKQQCYSGVNSKRTVGEMGLEL